jgi:hypothetical protein
LQEAAVQLQFDVHGYFIFSWTKRGVNVHG